jgi:hypothetical protein
MSDVLLTTVAPVVLSFVLYLLHGRLGKVLTLLMEVRDLLNVIAALPQDGKTTPEQTAAVVKEVKDVATAAENLVKLS